MRTAGYTKSLEWARKQPAGILACRGRGQHYWRQIDRLLIRSTEEHEGYYFITQQCPDCTLRRWVEMDYYGDQFWKQIDYNSVEGYLSQIGRIDAAAVRTVDLEQYEIPTSIEDRMPHRTGFAGVPTVKAKRRRA